MTESLNSENNEVRSVENGSPFTNSSAGAANAVNELDRLFQYQKNENRTLDDFIQECLRTVSHALAVDRAGLWFIGDHGTILTNHYLFDAKHGSSSSEGSAVVGNASEFVQSFSGSRFIAVADALGDPKTASLVKDYLRPNDIRSKLDVLMLSGQEFRAVLSCEKTGSPHEWTENDTLFAGSVADLLSVALARAERVEFQSILTETNDWAVKKSQSLNRFALVAQHTTDAIIITNPAGEIEWVNKGFEALTEYSQSEVIGKKPGSILQGANTSNRCIRELSKAIFDKTPIHLEILNYSKSGREYWLDIRIEPIYSNNGEIENFIAVERDVTERVQERQQLAAALEATRSAIQTKSDFLATMSHEMRTPLNGVLAIGRLLQTGGFEGDYREKVDLIVQSGEHLLATLNNILDTAALESGSQELEFQEYSVKTIIQQTSALLSDYAAEKNLSIDINTDPSVPDTILGDSGKMSQILFNLIGNAVKFSEDGVIRIQTIAEKQSDNTAKITCSVEDHGIGITADIIPTLFEPFTQGDPSATRNYGGTGLGLSICKNLCEMMGGEISVTSIEGSGSTFKFSFTGDIVSQKALASFDRDLPQINRPAETAFNFDTPTVLVAEDNAMNQQVIKMVMEAMGMSPDCVANGQEAIDALALKSYDLVLMDIQMPIKDGVTATREIRQSGKAYSSIPIIAVTANIHESATADYIAAGMDGIVPKPIKPSVLMREIENVFRSERECNALAS